MMTRERAYVWLVAGVRTGVATELRHSSRAPPCRGGLVLSDVLRNPETGAPFDLYPAQERFLREALTPGPDGRLPYSEMVYSCPKKSGKTATAAMATIYVVVVLGVGTRRATASPTTSNNQQAASSRPLPGSWRRALSCGKPRRSCRARSRSRARARRSRPWRATTRGQRGRIRRSSFDELWGYMSERAHRLWDEMVPVPTRAVSVRLTITYAGVEGESDLLEALYKRGLRGEEVAPSLYTQPGLLLLWSHEPVAPWPPLLGVMPSRGGKIRTQQASGPCIVRD